MTEQVCMSEEWKTRQHWYTYYRFPLIPYWCYRPEDKYNLSSLHIDWLNISFWTNISFCFGFELQFEDSNAYLKLNLPYCHLVFNFLWFPLSWHQKLWRVKKWNTNER